MALIAAALALTVAAVCTATEVALQRANKLFVELQRQQGALWARAMALPMERPGHLVMALVLGNCTATVAFTIIVVDGLGTLWAAGMDPGWLAVLGVLLPFTLLFLLGEWLPDLLGRTAPHTVLRFCALPLRLLHVLLWLPAAGLVVLSEAVSGSVGLRAPKVREQFGRPDLDRLLEAADVSGPEGAAPEAEVSYFHKALHLRTTRIDDLLVPRADVVAIDLAASVAELRELFVESGLSKLPVYSDTIDNVVGYVHGNELFRRPATIREVMRPIPHLPGSLTADQALHLFTRQRTQLAVVVDDQGATAGILTIEDVVETIVGDIQDEHDESVTMEERLGPGSFLLSARAYVTDLNERYGWHLPVDDAYDTLGGLVVHRFDGLPPQGTVMDLADLRLTVVQVAGGRIDLVHVALRNSA